MTDLDHLNSRERAYRLAQRKARVDEGRGWNAPASVTPKSGLEVCPEDPAEAALRFDVEVVKASIAEIVRRHPGGLAYGWDGDRLMIRFPLAAEVITVEEAVRQHLIGPGWRW